MGRLKADLYVEIYEGRLSVTNLDTGAAVTSATTVTVPRRKGGQPRLVAPAELEAARVEAGQGRVELVDGFGHQRVLVGDFIAAEVALRALVRRVLPNRWQRVGRLLIHIQRELEGEVTDVELRAVREMGEYLGAKKVYICRQPCSLSLHEVKRLLGAGPRREPSFSL